MRRGAQARMVWTERDDKGQGPNLELPGLAPNAVRGPACVELSGIRSDSS